MGCSAHVDLWLEVDGQRIDVSQVGDGTLYTRHDIDLPDGCCGVLGIQVDDNLEETGVMLRRSGGRKYTYTEYNPAQASSGPA